MKTWSFALFMLIWMGLWVGLWVGEMLLFEGSNGAIGATVGFFAGLVLASIVTGVGR